MLWINAITARRKLLYALTLGCSLAMPALVQQASQWKAQADAQRQRLNSAQQQMQQARSSQSRLTQWHQASRHWSSLSARASQHGLSTDLWDARSVQVDGKRLSRQEVDTLLTSLATDKHAFMLPTAFTLKLLSEQGSLLITSPAQDRPDSVYLTLSGTYYSRRIP